MIIFHCACGKKYKLPDRNAGRIVRCNQCEHSLQVPERSQEEPVIPIDVQTPETAPVVEKSLELLPPEPSPLPSDIPESSSESVPAEIVARETSDIATSDTVDSQTPAELPPLVDHSDDPFAAVGGGLDIAVAEADPFAEPPPVAAPPVITTENADPVSDPVIDEKAASPSIPPVVTPAPSVVKPDKPGKIKVAVNASSKRTGVSEEGIKWKLPAAALILGLMLGLIFALLFLPSGPKSTGENAVTTSGGAVANVPVTGKATLNQVLTAFGAVRFAPHADGETKITVRTDENPKGKTDAQAALGDLAGVLDDGQGASFSSQSHEATLRIEVAGPGTFGITCPVGENGDTVPDRIKEVRLCLLFSEGANQQFEPKPVGALETPFELAEFSVRLGQGADFIELRPKSMEWFAKYHVKGRQNWIDVVLPLGGDDNWTAKDFGTRPTMVQWIELQGKPSGQGIVFWLDNLKLTP